MFPTHLIVADRIGNGLELSSKKRLLERLGVLLASADPNLSPEGVFGRLCERERLGSTARPRGCLAPCPHVGGNWSRRGLRPAPKGSRFRHPQQRTGRSGLRIVGTRVGDRAALAVACTVGIHVQGSTAAPGPAPSHLGGADPCAHGRPETGRLGSMTRVQPLRRPDRSNRPAIRPYRLLGQIETTGPARGTAVSLK